jgi:integrase
LTLPAGLVDLLAAHFAVKGLTAAKPDGLVFTSHDGSPLNYANWRNRVWLPAVRQAGVQGVGFHDLRRTNATQLGLSGIYVKTVQTRLGQVDPRLTLAVYAQAVSQTDHDAAERLDERFFGSRTDRARRRSG